VPCVEKHQLQLLVAWQPAQVVWPWHAGQDVVGTEEPVQSTPVGLQDDQLPEHQVQPGMAVHWGQLSPLVQPPHVYVVVPPVMLQSVPGAIVHESPGGPWEPAPSHQTQPRLELHSWQDA